MSERLPHRAACRLFAGFVDDKTGLSTAPSSFRAHDLALSISPVTVASQEPRSTSEHNR